MLFLCLQLFQTGLHGGNIPAEHFRACILYMLKFLQKQSIFSAQFLQFLRQLCKSNSQFPAADDTEKRQFLFPSYKCGTLSGFFLDLLYQTGATLQLRPPYPVSKEYWAYI